MPAINSPNMILPIPSIGTTAGPEYAQDINNALTLVDQHDHTPGKGVQITPLGMNINSNLSFGGNSGTNIAALTLVSQSSVPANGSLYMASDGTIHYVDFSTGFDTQITLVGGGVAGSPGSISNLTSPASAAYVAAQSKFVWESNVSKAANMDFGAAIMRNLTPNSTNALTLQPPAALSSNFTLTLPVIPSTTSIMQMDTSGNMLTTLTTDNTSITIVSNQLTVGTIGTANIAPNSVTGSQISSSANILGSQLSASANILGSQISSSANITPNQLNSLSTPYTGTSSIINFSTSSTSFTNVTGLVSVGMSNNTSNRPVFIYFQGSIAVSNIQSSTVQGMDIRIKSNSSGNPTIASFNFEGPLDSTKALVLPAGCCNAVDLTGGSAYTVQIRVNNGAGSPPGVSSASLENVVMTLVQV